MPGVRYRCCAHCRPGCRDSAEGHVVPCLVSHCPGRIPFELETEG